MAHSIMFDTLLYANKLKNAGVIPAQAEAQAETMGEIFEQLHVNNREIRDLQKDMDIKFIHVDTRFAEMRAEMIKWMIAVSAGQAALIISMVKLFH